MYLVVRILFTETVDQVYCHSLEDEILVIMLFQLSTKPSCVLSCLEFEITSIYVRHCTELQY